MADESKSTDPEDLYKSYLDERSTLLTSSRELSKAYDTWVLTLSGGALGLSMTFVKDIVSPAKPECPILLLLSWALLAGAILSIMIGLYQSPIAHSQYIKILDDIYNDLNKRPYWKCVRDEQLKLKRPKIVGILNHVSLICLIIAVLSMSYFTYLNLK
ncbi:MAG: hypothetical protein MI923_09305 [Phycisphaerales bacterium]|nr:hypothetical protein [Phycisphaerales bacterium]